MRLVNHILRQGERESAREREREIARERQPSHSSEENSQVVICARHFQLPSKMISLFFLQSFTMRQMLSFKLSWIEAKRDWPVMINIFGISTEKWEWD